MYALKETNGDWYIKTLRPFIKTQCPSEALKFNSRTDADETMYLLLMADFVIDKAEAWLRENATDYLDKIEDCYGGNEGEPQTWSFPDEFFTRFRNELKNE